MAKINFTAAKVAAFECPPDKKQVFMWDSHTLGLGLRATPKGKSAYVFQGELDGKTKRVTIGSPEAWPLAQARDKARELQRLIDEGIDPHTPKREAIAQQKAAQELDHARALTFGQAWQNYIEARRPYWGELHLLDHIGMMQEGGQVKKRGKGLTKAGPLAGLAPLPLSQLTPETIEAWAAKEGQERPARARLARSLLQAFLNWCKEQPDMAQALPSAEILITRQARQALGKAKAKTDSLEREQLRAWFAAVQGISNPAISAYLQGLLLTGARPNELLGLKWADINTTWRSMTMRDKDESKGGQDGLRVIPLTPYMQRLLAGLPKRGPYVFAGTEGKPLHKPNTPHTTACAVAGLPHITLHGLRRSFGSLAEWLELPAGVVAQIQGHKPSATAEKHYRVRPLDLLRLHHEKFEAWILEQAGIEHGPAKAQEPAPRPTLKVVKG